jgi:hypothetical protein
MTSKGVSFHPSPRGQFSAVVDRREVSSMIELALVVLAIIFGSGRRR